MGNDQFFKNPRNFREKRKQANKSSIDTIHILCEGEKTEPNYFENFRLKNVSVCGRGEDPSQLIKKAKKEINNYDQVWCVFDRDSVPPEKFNIPFQLSEKQRKKIKLAYSNEAFELWYLLHFNYYDTGISRDQYIKKLSEQLGHKYEKKSETIYDELLDRQQTAIDNAKRLYESYPNPNPEKDNPSTTVHLLVEGLNKYKK